MKRGRKPELPSQHLAKGTFQPCRHGEMEVIAPGVVIDPSALPAQPDWLTDAGKQVWLDDIGRVSSTHLATELDSTLFATYCNLQGAIVACWRVGEVPPAAHLMEARKMQEMFGIAGARSRIMKPGGAAQSNPFLRNGRK